jgi:prophage regulatory protein
MTGDHSVHNNIENCGLSPQHEAGYARPAMVAPPASCTTEPIRILRLPEVMARIGICRASIYNKIAEGSFPKQIILGPRTVGWLESEINAWLTNKIEAR